MTTRFYPHPDGAPGGAARKDTRRLRVLVRGSGSIGARHLRVLAGLGVGEIFAWPVRPNAELPARPDIPDTAIVVDSVPAGLDLVIIATDTARHVDDTLEALSASPRALLLEKPASARAGDAAPLLGHPEASRISVSAPLRFHDGLLRLAGLLPDLGDITSARVRSQSWLPDWRPGRDYRESYSARAAEGGVLRDLVHDIDYPAWLFGTPTLLTGRLGHGTLGIEAEESADLSWTAGSRARPIEVSVRLDYITRSKTRDLRVVASGGTAGWDVVGNTVSHTAGGAAREYSFPADGSVDTVLARQTSAVLERSGALASQDQARFTPATLLDGVGAVAVCDAARRASASENAETVGW
ncbi:oxidoreductase [Arthrobacter zhaoguopingii]|uniref:oxidoreductase n=1 Tax=Arthrobacter zhaoguopingii TaxID=2681491 RepID=UPI00135C875C|nr:oxidoreductase [Arthrobacter zhaoguopingii]